MVLGGPFDTYPSRPVTQGARDEPPRSSAALHKPLYMRVEGCCTARHILGEDRSQLGEAGVLPTNRLKQDNSVGCRSTASAKKHQHQHQHQRFTTTKRASGRGKTKCAAERTRGVQNTAVAPEPRCSAARCQPRRNCTPRPAR